MKYLHNTSVKFHGNLTSTRCVIDSHWVVKITDWGLHEFKAGQENTKSVHKMYSGESDIPTYPYTCESGDTFEICINTYCGPIFAEISVLSLIGCCYILSLIQKSITWSKQLSYFAYDAAFSQTGLIFRILFSGRIPLPLASHKRVNINRYIIYLGR